MKQLSILLSTLAALAVVALAQVTFTAPSGGLGGGDVAGGAWRFWTNASAANVGSVVESLPANASNALIRWTMTLGPTNANVNLNFRLGTNKSVHSSILSKHYSGGIANQNATKSATNAVVGHVPANATEVVPSTGVLVLWGYNDSTVFLSFENKETRLAGNETGAFGQGSVTNSGGGATITLWPTPAGPGGISNWNHSIWVQ